MKRRVWAGVIAFSAILAGSLVGASTASATIDEIQMQSSITAVGNGTWTQADLDYIMQDPAIADQIIDPRPSGVESGVTEGVDESYAEAGPPEPTVTYCGAYLDVWYTHKSLLGSTIYTWHHKVVYFRIPNQRVTKWQARFDFLGYHQSIVHVEELVADTQWGIGTFTAHSYKQRHIELCVLKYGCYADLYPHSQLNVNANAGTSYSGGAT